MPDRRHPRGDTLTIKIWSYLLTKLSWRLVWQLTYVNISESTLLTVLIGLLSFDLTRFMAESTIAIGQRYKTDSEGD